jgi:chorismate synthase
MMRFLTAGESHGKALTVIIDSFPSNVEIDTAFINNELSKRQKGIGRGARMKIESDKIEILSGVRDGKTTGAPICFNIKNRDWKNWEHLLSPQKQNHKTEHPVLNPRPGHADINGYIKYRLNDIRDVIERSSARETAARTAVGSFAKILLGYFGVKFYSYVFQIGKAVFNDDGFHNYGLLEREDFNDLRCPDNKVYQDMLSLIKKAQKEGDTLGGAFKVISSNVPIGLGSYNQWDNRLDANISRAIMSIPAIKAVGIGRGSKSAGAQGLEFHDEIFFDGERGFYRKTNNSGGIEGGISNGEEIIVSAYMKPIPTTMEGLNTTNIKTKKNEKSLKERSDVCAVPAASLVGEAVLAIELAVSFSKKFGGDSIDEIMQNYNNYQRFVKNI